MSCYLRKKKPMLGLFILFNKRNQKTLKICSLKKFKNMFQSSFLDYHEKLKSLLVLPLYYICVFLKLILINLFYLVIYYIRLTMSLHNISN